PHLGAQSERPIGAGVRRLCEPEVTIGCQFHDNDTNVSIVTNLSPLLYRAVALSAYRPTRRSRRFGRQKRGYLWGCHLSAGLPRGFPQVSPACCCAASPPQLSRRRPRPATPSCRRCSVSSTTCAPSWIRCAPPASRTPGFRPSSSSWTPWPLSSLT